MDSKRIYSFLITAVIFFAIIGGLFLATSGSKKANTATPSESLAPSSDNAIETPSGNAVKVIEPPANHSVVEYNHGAFTPAMITLKNETGCFVEIKNASDEEVIPRVGPYVAGKESGFLYGKIGPRQSESIDPRYGTLNDLTFYNKNNPAAFFKIHLDPTCL